MTTANNKVYLKSPQEKLRSLLADEAKNVAMLEDMSNTLRQIRAKSSFRLALINQLQQQIKDENK